jgi:flagellar motor switch protein FliN
MTPEIVSEEIRNLLPEVAKFLTSVVYEETTITLIEDASVEKDALIEHMQKSDIYVLANVPALKSEVIMVLDPVWYGLLSSIMLGVEEKGNNEITRDLLQKFGGDMAEALKGFVKVEGTNADPGNIQVLTATQLAKVLSHGTYYRARFDVAGLADETVRAEVLIGDPATHADILAELKRKAKKDAAAALANFDEEPAGTAFVRGGQDNGHEPSSNGGAVRQEDLINAKRVEFDDFGEASSMSDALTGGNIDILRDVEMEVSVQLGQIEMPLGKVLQLTKGSVLELDKLAGEPVDILVNGHRIATGEVVVIDEHFGVRISNLISTRERLNTLK